MASGVRVGTVWGSGCWLRRTALARSHGSLQPAPIPVAAPRARSPARSPALLPAALPSPLHLSARLIPAPQPLGASLQPWQ